MKNDTYLSPEIFDFGSVTERTGHCSDGCDHDAPILHPDEHKSGGAVAMLAAGC